jgi:hypothetical protein
MSEENKPFWRRPAVRIGLAIAVIAAFYLVYLGFVKRDMSDFGVCYRNGQRILAGETLYRISDGHLQFKYAPAAALFYSWLALMPYDAAKIVWYFLELIFLFGGFLIGWRMIPGGKKGLWFVAGLGFAVLAKLIGREIELGQVNLLIIFLLLLMAAAFLKRKDGAAGALWAVSLLFKPYALIFLPYFILKRRWRIPAWGAGVLFAGLALPMIEFGVRGNFAVLKEWAVTLSHSTPGLMAVGDNASLYAFVWKLLPGDQPGVTKAVWLAFGLAAAAGFLWMMREGREKNTPGAEVLELSFLMVLIPFFSPLGWYYNYLYALPAVLLVLGRWTDVPAAWKWILGFDFLIIGGTLREILGTVLFRFYTHHSLIAMNFLALLAGLSALRARKIA